MRILAAGGAGFIGYHLCERLLSEGNEVACVDNLVTGSRKNADDLKTNTNFEFVDADITEPDIAKKIGKNGKFDAVFNLACPASPVDYQNIPIETLGVCSAGTENLIKIALNGGAVFVHASTSEVYGDPAVHPQPESYWGNVNPQGVRSCYDEGKRYAEALCMAYRRKKGLDVRIARIFNTYGPRMRPDDGRVVSNFVTQAIAGKPLTVYGDGKQSRSYCYVSDMVDGLCLLASKKGIDGETFNLGNPTEFSIIETAKKIIEITKSKSEIEYLPLPPDDPRQRRPDISKARGVLGFEPKVSFDRGLSDTVEWFLANP
jgi:nucleoside-diphosphate-sugar epimerase